jgi:hypothetical protein
MVDILSSDSRVIRSTSRYLGTVAMSSRCQVSASRFEQATVAQILGGFHNGGLGGAWTPSKLSAGSVVVDDRPG